MEKTNRKPAQKCSFCLQEAESKFEWEHVWSTHCAESLEKLLNLDPFTASFFEVAEYCTSCKEIIRDVDFMSRSVSALERRLSQSRQQIAQMLLDNFDVWSTAVTDTDQVICQAAGTRIVQGTTTISPPIDQSLLIGNPNASIDPDMTLLKSSLEYSPVDSSLSDDGDFKPLDLGDYALSTTLYPESILDGIEQQGNVQPPLQDGNMDFSSCSSAEVEVGVRKRKKISLGFLHTSKRQKHSLTDDGVFHCEFPGCKKLFSRLYHLDCHKSSHRGWRPFKCTMDSCSATFTRKQHLVRHTKNTHRHHRKTSTIRWAATGEGAQERPTRDSHKLKLRGLKEMQNTTSNLEIEAPGVQPDSFSSESLESNHPFIRNAKVGNSEESSEFVCDFPECRKKFRRIYHLDCHKPTHVGWRSYKCDVSNCSATFIRRQHLVKHIKRTHGNTDDASIEDDTDTTLFVPKTNDGGESLKQSTCSTITQDEDPEDAPSSSRRSMRLLRRPSKPHPSLQDDDIIQDDDSDKGDEDNQDSEYRISSESENDGDDFDTANNLRRFKEKHKPRNSGSGRCGNRNVTAILPSLGDNLTSSVPSSEEQEEIDTSMLAVRISAEMKRYGIPQAAFAKRVLGRTQGTLSALLQNPKPWSELHPKGREPFRQMWNWLQEFQGMTSLRMAVGDQPVSAATSNEDEVNEPNQPNLIENDKTGNSAEPAGFVCDFPECNQQFQALDLLETHKHTHVGWKSFKCTVSICSAAFTTRQHLVHHIDDIHSIEHNGSMGDTNTTPLGLEINHCGDALEEPPMDTQDTKDTSSSNRRSVRLHAKPRKQQQSQSQEDDDSSGKADEEKQDSDFRMSSDSENKGEDFDAANNKQKVTPPMSSKSTAAVNTSDFQRKWDMLARRQGCLDSLTQRLISICFTKYSEMSIEVAICSTTTGEFPTWESILGSPESPLPEETFEATFGFVFKLNQQESEKGFRYACPMSVCHRRFNHTDILKTHMWKIHGEFQKSFQCFICDRRAPSAVDLDSHIAKVHFEETHPFHCPVPLCFRQYKFHQKLNTHVASQHPEIEYKKKTERPIYKNRVQNSRTFYCEEDGCSYRTTYAKYMKAHQIQSHSQAEEEGGLPYECETCGAKFKTIPSYKGHTRTAHRDKNIMCEFCGTSFSQRYQLSDHMRWKHFDVAIKFRCKVCTRIYFNEEDCDTHEVLHTKVPPFSCVLQCGQRMRQFGNSEDLIKHVQGFHDEMKKVVCHCCGFTATGPNAVVKLNRHLISHTGVKTHKCKYCSKTFRQDGEKFTHEQIHHQDQAKKEYKCDICQEIFHVYQYFYRHRRNKHGSNPIPPFKRKKAT